MPILADPTKCVECLFCELHCSLKLEKSFNPLKAAIQIRRVATSEVNISFTEHCDDCGLCPQYCPYGALSWERAKKEDT